MDDPSPHPEIRHEGTSGVAFLNDQHELETWDVGFTEITRHLGLSTFELAHIFFDAHERAETRLTLRAPGGTQVRCEIGWVALNPGWKLTVETDHQPRSTESHKSLLSQLQELERRNRELEILGLSIAHDLGSPIRAARGYAVRLREGQGSVDEEAARDMFDRLLRNLDRASSLMTALMDLTRAIQRPLDRRPVPLSDFAQTIAENLIELEGNQNLQIRVDEGMHTEGDPALIFLLLENLMSNAVKFCRHRDLPVVSVVQSSTGVFAVVDNGIGFSAQDAPKLFEPFSRFHDSSYEGHGLGLHISRRIVERHGGMLWASSIPNGGARFGFMLTPGNPAVISAAS